MVLKQDTSQLIKQYKQTQYLNAIMKFKNIFLSFMYIFTLKYSIQRKQEWKKRKMKSPKKQEIITEKNSQHEHYEKRAQNEINKII